MAENPINPDVLQGLGRIIHIAGTPESGAVGTPIYVKHPDQYKLDNQPITEFQIHGRQSIQPTGLDSGRLHSLTYSGKDPYYQTTLTQTPDDGGAFVWKTVGAVSFIDKKGDKITIPRNELTLTKPKPEGAQSELKVKKTVPSSPDADEITTPVKPLPEKKRPAQSTTKTGSTIDQSGQIHRSGRTTTEKTPSGGKGKTKKPRAENNSQQPVDTTPGIGGDSAMDQGMIDVPPTTPNPNTQPVAAGGGIVPIAGGAGGAPLPPDAATGDVLPIGGDSAMEAGMNDETSLTPESPTPVASTPPEQTPPVAPREELRNMARKPEAISVVGEDVKPMEGERAAKNTQQIVTEAGFFGKIWKGNIANELVEEHQRQYVHKLTEEAHMMVSDATWDIIQKRANEQYEEAMKKKTRLGRAWTKFADGFVSNIGIGGLTSKERMAVAIAGDMYAKGELDRIDSFGKNAEAIQVRFETNFVDGEGAIRKNLGESIRIVKAGTEEHRLLMGELMDIRAAYLDGSINDVVLNDRIAAFGKKHVTGNTNLYTSSLVTLIKNDKAQIADGIDRQVLDAQIAKMDIRLGMAQMGESTQFQQSQAEKIVTWMVSKNIVGTLFANEASAGTAAAVALTLGYLPRYVASRVARVGLGAVGGGAVAGTIAGLKENARMKREYFTYLRERETGGGLPQPGDKLRAWMQEREIQQMDVTELINRMVGTAYQDGKLKSLSDGELQQTLAYLADAKARRSISARGGENISLIRWGTAVDVARTNLDLSIDKLERDLAESYTGSQAQFGGQTIGQYIKSLSDVQSRVLTEGRANVTDPLITALGAVSDKDPSVTILRRRILGLYGKADEKGTAQGLDASLREVKTAIRYEAVRRGVTAGVIGTAIGTALSEVGHISEQIQNLGFIKEAHYIPPTQIPTHAIEVAGIPHYTDLQGVDHAVMAQIPDHTALVADATNHTYTLVDEHGAALMHGINIDQSGEIVNANALNSSPEALLHGLHFSNLTNHEILPGTPGVPGTPEGPITGGGFDISAGEMAKLGGSNNGEWGWISHNMGAADVQHVNPATNITTKLFHYYETNVTHNQNLDIEQIPGYHRVIHYLTDGQGNQTVNYNSMPDNLWFRNLPDLFRPEHQAEIGHTMDNAMDLYHKVMAGTPESGPNYPGWQYAFDKMESSGDPNGHLYALMYKIGYVDKPLTDAEFNELTHLLAGPGTPEVPPIPAQELITHTGIIDQKIGEIGATVELDVLPVPAVAPLPRQGMMPARMESLRDFSNTTNIYYEYGYGGSGEDMGLLDRQRYSERFDNELRTNPNIDVRTDDSEIVRRYLDRQPADYRTELEQLVSGMPPMSPDTKLVITVPAYQEGQNITHTLEQYAKMNNLDKIEIVILENHPKDTIRDDTGQKIAAFMTSHPTMHITHLYKSFDTKQPIGKIRKYLVDSVLLRKQAAGIKPSLIIVSNDADLVDISPDYGTNLISTFDKNTNLDAVAAKWDFPKEAFTKMPLLHASQRLWQYFDITFRNRWLKSPDLIGRNSAFGSGIYAAVGGYNDNAKLAEDLEIGWLIKQARNYDSTRVKYVNSAWLVSNPRRAAAQLISGGRLIQQYGDFHENESVRRTPLADLLDAKRDFKPDEFQKEIQAIYDHYARWRKSNNGWVNDEIFASSFDKSMHLLGVEYHIENNKVVLDNIAKLEEGLNKYQSS